MATALAGDDLARVSSSRRSFGSSSRFSFKDTWHQEPDAFSRRVRADDDDEEELRWAAIERLPTRRRLGRSLLTNVLEDGTVKATEIDVRRLGVDEKRQLMNKILSAVEEDNERFLQRLRSRADRVGIETPKIEIRYEHLAVEGDVHVGSRALPTLINATLNSIETVLGLFRLTPSKKRKIQILKDANGIVRPSRITLLLGPPGAGKTTFLLSLAGKLDDNLRKSGKITYCGHEFNEFVPQRTCAYISQHDLHHGEMTVRETLDFSGRCLGVGQRYEMLAELSRREKEAGIKPDPEIDAFMKATSISGQKTSLVTDYVLKILGLDICPDTIVGDDMRRGEMLVGPAKALFMDEISTGLDSSTTFQIIKYMRQMVHIMDVTMIVSLLQPAPETYNLFDDVILLSEALFTRPKARQELSVPYDKSKAHPRALVKEMYGISNWELFRACFSREWLLMKRNSFVYIFKTSQITIMAVIAFTVFLRTEMPFGQLTDGGKFFGALFFSLINVMFNGMAELAMTVFRLPVFYKQRDFLFYPAWAFGLPIWILRIPLSILESAIWIVLTYYTIGFAPSAGRFFRQFLTFFSIHQMALSLFRFIAAVGRTQVVATTLGTFTLLVVFVLGGFIVAKDDLDPWLKWAYYVSPMSYGQNAIVMNEFLDERWSTIEHSLGYALSVETYYQNPYISFFLQPNTDPRFHQPTVGKVLLQSRGFYTEDYWFWICVAALIGFSILFNVLFIAALTFLNPLGDSNTITLDDDDSKKKKNSSAQGTSKGVDREVQQTSSDSLAGTVDHTPKKGMEMKAQGVESDRLQLLRDVSGAFRPGVLTALVGVSGAGKTTLMDVLAGRKTGGFIEGDISISGYPKNQATFARISGYCEQNDIHSPHVTVYESVLYSAWLRLPAEMFVEEVMELVELNPIRNSLVGLPGVDGLSTEQRKRLTIAVELVANPSIIFMDEPTSGLDARAAAIVMRTVRNTVDTGRTVVCTIHQPSIDIFEAFDEAVPGVPKIEEGYNPATWMLDISTPAAEVQLGVDFADIYAKSSLYQRNQELIKELSTPPPDSKDLYFPTKYSQPFLTQCKACFWKQYWSYWRNPQYNAIRFFMTIAIGVIFGIIFWDKGQKTEKQQDLQNLLGAIYAAVLFLGATNSTAVQCVVSIERTVFYRERAAGMYSALPYAYAQVAIETIYVAVQTAIYTLLLYSMIGFEWTIGKFFWFYYFMFTCFVYFVLYGMMLIALTPGLQVGAITASFFLSFWNLFSGFLVPRTQIPIWWRWYYWGSPVAWTIYGLVTSQIGDLTSQFEVPGVGLMTVKAYLKSSLGYDHDFLPIVGLMHLVFILLFVFIFAFGIKCLNFQRR
ncbi:hypothetical protein DH2020_014956 [Rehmannia glutinosa]|uniref:ABC transporter domain-containing protein n=1 Tax=Rehmannia glutinosa TaxID=99300 RepID=A0ABR0WZF1_REHGL